MRTSASVNPRPASTPAGPPAASRRLTPRDRRIDMLASQPYYIVNDFDELSPNGVIGLPSFADAEKGLRFLDSAANSAIAFIRDFATWSYQEAGE